MTSSSRIVIVGASIGGLTVAEILRSEGFDGSVVLLGDEDRLPYNRPPLSKQVLLGEWEATDAAIRSPEEIQALDIEIRTGETALGVDLNARTLHTDAGPTTFDELVIATGTEPQAHPVLPGAPALRTMDDALRLRDLLAVARRTAVIGSGILGSELASAARKYGSDALLIGRSGTLSFGGVGSLLSDELARLHAENGVELSLRNEIVTAEPLSPGGYRLSFDNSSTRDVDLAVVMIGGLPRTGWLAGSGLEIGDGVICDSTGLAAPGVSAVGDVASWLDPIAGTQRRVEHQSNAIEQAIAVGKRLARGVITEAPVVPLFWSEIHETRITAYGWFSPDGAWDSLPAEKNASSRIFGSSDPTGALRGVVGWNTKPADFRRARSHVDIEAASPVSTS